MDIKITSFFTCDYFTVDVNNKPSVIGIFKDLNITTIPATVLKITLVAFLLVENKDKKTEPEPIKIKVRIFDPNDGEIDIKVPELNVVLDPQRPNGIISVEIGNLSVTAFGEYKFKLFRDDKVLDSTIINVKKI